MRRCFITAATLNRVQTMKPEVQYIIGIILCVGAIATVTTQPYLSLVIAVCAVITLGRLLRELL